MSPAMDRQTEMGDEKRRLSRVKLFELVDPPKAILHALDEAGGCITNWHLCAATAMIRKALDLWSGEYRDKHDLKFDRQAGERDDLFWRLEKIAAQNPLYRDSIHTIMQQLRDDGNDALHHPMVCIRPSTPFPGMVHSDSRRAIRETLRQVAALIASTMPVVRP